MLPEADLARQLHHRGQLPAALDAYRKACAQQPADIALLRDFGVCQLQAGNPRAARDVLAQIAPSHPSWFDAALPLAVAQRACRQYSDALDTLRMLLARQPGLRQAHWLQASLHCLTGNHGNAIPALRRLLQDEPGHMEGWHYLATSLQACGEHQQAMQAHARVAAVHPEAWSNVALCAEQCGQLDLALSCYQRLDAAPDPRAALLARLAHLQARLCQLDASRHTAQRLAARLQHPDRLAEDDLPEPFVCCTLLFSATAYRALLQRHSRHVAASVVPLEVDRPARRDQHLRIGYLSADFGSHAVGHLLDSLFASHDHSRIRLYLYSLSTRLDEHEARLLAMAYASCNLAGSSDEQAARRIAADRLDVLIDLNGPTLGSRPGILARRPAPRQLGWLGFVSAQWSPWLDGQIMDAHVAPAGSPWLAGETIHHLHDCFLPAPTCSSAPPATRASLGLPDDAVLLLACHAAYKLDARALHSWAEITRNAPDSCLCVALPVEARAGFLDAWRSAGGDDSRLLWLDNLARDQHLARLPCFDLLLDAFAYGAGATAMDAATAGLPILTLPGQAPWTRMATSVNRQLGLDELVCESGQDYIDRAIALCNDRVALAMQRQRLHNALQASSLTDPRRAARAIEALCDRLMEQ